MPESIPVTVSLYTRQRPSARKQKRQLQNIPDVLPCLLYTSVNTRNILFICGGAFPDLENIIKERLNKQASIGFYADLKEKYDNDPHLLQKEMCIRDSLMYCF